MQIFRPVRLGDVAGFGEDWLDADHRRPARDDRQFGFPGGATGAWLARATGDRQLAPQLVREFQRWLGSNRE